jgi:hypothetical protein
MLTSQARNERTKLRADASSHVPSLSRCGDYWNVHFHGRTLCVRDGKGMEDLARLISGPSEGLHVLELYQDAAARTAVPHGAGSAHTDGLSIVRHTNAWEERSDVSARAAYRARYTQLVETLEEARERNDVGRVERCEQELAQLLAELKQRRFVNNPAAERARKAVYNRLHAAIRRLEQLDRELGTHLRRAIKTGNHCSYRPEPLHCLTCAGRHAQHDRG